MTYISSYTVTLEANYLINLRIKKIQRTASVNKATYVKFDETSGHYFTSDSRSDFIPFPICGIWFCRRYAHEIGIIVFVSHYLSRGRATPAQECGPIIRRKPKDLSQDLGNDRDVRIADNVARKTCHEFFMLSFTPKNSATNSKTFGQIDKKLMMRIFNGDYVWHVPNCETDN